MKEENLVRMTPPKGQSGVGLKTAESFHDIFLQWKNKKNKIPDSTNNNNRTLLSCLIELITIVADWFIDIIIAGFHFYQGRYLVGTLTLFFVFVGGLFVNFTRLVLMKRKGEREFKNELKKIHPVLLYLIYVPSFLPFFSGSMQVYFAYKLRKLNSKTDASEIERLERLLNICEDQYFTDLLYESSFEAYPQAILQIMILIEKPAYKSLFDFLPLVGVFSAWYGISMTPIKFAKSLNNIKIKWTETVSSLANKSVTLLSFTLMIAACRRNYADTYTVNSELVSATLLTILVLSIFSEIPGIIGFHLELRQRKRNSRVTRDWEFLVNLISLLIPLTAITYWIVTMYYDDDLKKVRVIVLCSIFISSLILNIIGFLTYKNYLPWLGQVSMDSFLLLYIGFYSHFNEFHQQIDFHYEPQDSVDVVDVNVPIFRGETSLENDHEDEEKFKQEK